MDDSLELCKVLHLDKNQPPPKSIPAYGRWTSTIGLQLLLCGEPQGSGSIGSVGRGSCLSRVETS